MQWFGSDVTAAQRMLLLLDIMKYTTPWVPVRKNRIVTAFKYFLHIPVYDLIHLTSLISSIYVESVWQRDDSIFASSYSPPLSICWTAIKIYISMKFHHTIASPDTKFLLITMTGNLRFPSSGLWGWSDGGDFDASFGGYGGGGGGE